MPNAGADSPGDLTHTPIISPNAGAARRDGKWKTMLSAHKANAQQSLIVILTAPCWMKAQWIKPPPNIPPRKTPLEAINALC